MKKESTLEEKIKGLAAENFFKRAMEMFAESKSEFPPWILGVRKASRGQDLKGIDFIVTTDVGEINVQIKSSFGYAKRYIRNHAKAPFEVCIIVMSGEDTYVSLFRRTRTILSRRRQKMLFGTKKKFLLSMPSSFKATI